MTNNPQNPDRLSIQGHELESGEPDIYQPIEFSPEDRADLAAVEAFLDRTAPGAILGIPARIFQSPQGSISQADEIYWNRGLDRLRKDLGLTL